MGYFPPAIAGAIHVSQNRWGKLLIWLYQVITRRLGYLDRADFSLERETEEAARKQFKTVSKVVSGSHKRNISRATKTVFRSIESRLILLSPQ